jgi:hypothetical protein
MRHVVPRAKLTGRNPQLGPNLSARPISYLISRQLPGVQYKHDTNNELCL